MSLTWGGVAQNQGDVIRTDTRELRVGGGGR